MSTVGMRAKEVIEIGVYVLWTRNKGGRYRKRGAIKWRMGGKHLLSICCFVTIRKEPENKDERWGRESWQ